MFCIVIGGLSGVYTAATGETQIAGMDSYWLDKSVAVSDIAMQVAGTNFQDVTGIEKLEDRPYNPIDEAANVVISGLNLTVWTLAALVTIVISMGAVILALVSAPDIIILPFQIVFNVLGVEEYFSMIFGFIKLALRVLIVMYALKFIMYLKNGVSV